MWPIQSRLVSSGRSSSKSRPRVMSKINTEEAGKRAGRGLVSRKGLQRIKGGLQEQREEDIMREHKREIKGECD